MQYMPDVADPGTHPNISLDDILIKDEIVMDKLNKLRSDKATGASDISPKLLTRIKEVCLPLTIIFQNSLETRQVSCDWRTTDVTPIYKKGSCSQPSNYRPVSLTNHICRMFESIVRDSVVFRLAMGAFRTTPRFGNGASFVPYFYY